jgi:hypothetical protein
MTGAVYALNLFNVADRAEYLACSRRTSKEVAACGGPLSASPAGGHARAIGILFQPFPIICWEIIIRCANPGGRS